MCILYIILYIVNYDKLWRLVYICILSIMNNIQNTPSICFCSVVVGTLHLPVSYVISRLWLKRSGLINDFATEELCKRRSVCADLAWIFGKLRRLWRFGRRHATGWLCCRSCSHCLVALGAMHWWTKHAAHSRTNRSCSESSLNERFQGKVPGIALVHHHGLFLRLHVESGRYFSGGWHRWSRRVSTSEASRWFPLRHPGERTTDCNCGPFCIWLDLSALPIFLGISGQELPWSWQNTFIGLPGLTTFRGKQPGL